MQDFDETPTCGNLYVKGRVITFLPRVDKNIILPILAILVQPWLKPELQNALYKSEENWTKWKWEAQFSRTSPDNDSHPAQVPQSHPGMWWQPDYSGSQGDAGGYQHSVQRVSNEAPKKEEWP